MNSIQTERARLEIWFAGTKKHLLDAQETVRQEVKDGRPIAVDFWENDNRPGRYDVCVHAEGDQEHLLAHYQRANALLAPYGFV